MKKEGKILVVDDDLRILESCNQLLKHDFEYIETISNPNQLTSLLAQNLFDVILLDMNFQASISTGNEGLYWLREILNIDPEAIVIMITAYGDIDLAVESIKEGASYFMQKPWEPAKLIATIKSGLKFRKAHMQVKDLKEKQKLLNDVGISERSGIIGRSDPIMACLEIAEKVAGTDANILLQGENGTGKELFAREIHRLSYRQDEVFVSVDMGSVSQSIFESELFGHKKGSYTDAAENRKGRIEIANKGSLFLDEIGNLSMAMQSKILTALEQKVITPLGSNEKIEVDIRLISATNRDLKNMVTEKLFREDLLYRLNTIEICIPPLRERGEDIILLADYYLDKFRSHYRKPEIRLTGDTYEKLLQHRWPGNVRELKHAVERAVILADTISLKPSDFFNPDRSVTDFSASKVMSLSEMERNLIAKALEENEMNISRASQQLEISRSTLYSKMKRYDL